MEEETMTHIVAKAIEELRLGKLIIVADDENREAEGDMIGLAEFATSQTLNQMVTHARGLVCAPMSLEVAKRLNLPEMTNHNTDAFGTAFTISVDFKETTTGISTGERAHTLKELANSNAQPQDFLRPGHIFPLMAKEGGVIARRGHTEAAVDLAKLAGSVPVAYICEILNEDGTMARRQALTEIAKEQELVMITIEEIAEYRYLLNNEIVKKEASVKLPTTLGDFQMTAFSTVKDNQTQLIVSKGNLDQTEEIPLIRLHSECLTGDIFGSKRCDCGEQLELALTKIEETTVGAVLYLRQEGRGIGLVNKLKAYELQEQGMDTYEANLALGFGADDRDYGIAAAILKENGIKRLRLLTNNPDKVAALEKYGLEVVERVPLETKPVDENIAYLKTKKTKFRHFLDL